MLRQVANAVCFLAAWACVAFGGAVLIFGQCKWFASFLATYFEIEGVHHSAMAVALLVVFTALGGLFVAGHTALRIDLPGPCKWRRSANWAWSTLEVPLFGRVALAEAVLMSAWMALQGFAMYTYFANWKEHASGHGGGHGGGHDGGHDGHSGHGGHGGPWSTTSLLMGLCRMFGIGFAVNLAVLMIPVSKHSFWLELVDMGFERAVRLHRWIGVLLMVLVLLHAIFGIITYIHVGSLAYCMGWTGTVPEGGSYCQPMLVKINIFGEIALAGGVVLSVTSLPAVRRFSYQLFYYSHVVCALVFFVFGIIHDPTTLTFFFPGLATYVADKAISAWRRARACEVLHFSVNEDTDCTKLEIALAKGTPLPRQGHWYHVNVKEASVLQWHPMSVAEVNREDHSIVFYIRHDGDWSERLGQAARVRALQPDGLTVRLDGPFGGTHTRHSGYLGNDAAIFVCGGIGITAHALAVEAALSSGAFRLVALRWFVTHKAFVDQHMAVLEQLVAAGASVEVYITRPADPGEIFGELDLQPATRWSRQPATFSGWRYATWLESGIAKGLITGSAALGTLWAYKQSPGHGHVHGGNMGLERAAMAGKVFFASLVAALALAVAASLSHFILRQLDDRFEVWSRMGHKLSPVKLFKVANEALQEQRRCQSLLEASRIETGAGDEVWVKREKPHLEDVFADIASTLEIFSADLQLAGVSLCGPQRLVEGAIDAARAVSRTSAVNFVIDEEEYSF